MSKTMTGVVTLELTIHDPDAVVMAAREDFVSRGGSPSETDAWLGRLEQPDLANALTQLLGKGVPKGTGATVTHCSSRIDDPERPRLRTVVTVAASTGHLTAYELTRINDAFEMERDGPFTRCRDDILHDGLRISPKDCGFILRVPGEESLADKLEGLSPEMRALVDLAVEQGATRIEFDADEEPIDGLHYEEE